MENSPSTDIWMWSQLEENEWKEHSKADYYFAQLAWILAVSNGAKNCRLEDFLIEFGASSSERQLSQYEGMKHSMSVWETVTGKKAK